MPFQLPLGDRRVALVDHEDHDALARFRWRWRPVINSEDVQAARYIWANGKRRLRYLQDEIMQPPEGYEVIFLDRNRLDCRRHNLRVVPSERARKHRKNRRGSSGLKGLRYSQRERLWIVEITRSRTRLHVGKFRCQVDAILARDRALEDNAIPTPATDQLPDL